MSTFTKTLWTGEKVDTGLQVGDRVKVIAITCEARVFLHHLIGQEGTMAKDEGANTVFRVEFDLGKSWFATMFQLEKIN